MKCQCEHEAHETPCPNEAAWSVRTTYGTFKLCRPCLLEGHMVPYAREIHKIPPSPIMAALRFELGHYLETK